MEFKEQIQGLAEDFDVVLKSYYEEFSAEIHEENAKFREAIGYVLLGDGKRLRPILLLKTYEIFGGKDRDLAEAFAVALECIHNYSLVHDDLPCMDDDDYRRGRLTCHKVYGEDIALLVGDALLNMAYEIMLQASLHSSESNSLTAMKEIAFNAGANGMIGGQVMEIFTNARGVESVDVDTSLKVKMLKTSCLFSSSIVAGAILAGLDYDQVSSLEEYANLLGLAFQLKDDIMDKEYFVSKDADLKGLDQEELTLRVAQSFANSAKEKLQSLELKTDFYNELADYMVSRKK